VAKLISKTAVDKPAKPYADFPLFPHATKRWAKKICGKLHYFGPWSDPDGAIEKYQRQREDLYAGRTPRALPGGLAVRELANRFLTAKRHLLDTRELSQRSFADYYATCERIVTAFGRERLVIDLAADDFERLRASVAKVWGPVALGNEINRIRIVFKYGFDAGLIDTPVRFGPHFKRPSKKVLRKARHDKGPRMFEAVDIRAMLKDAPPTFRAMILLGINCGFGNADVGTLPLAAVDLAGGWINYPRPKTAIPRRAKLWPETTAALKAAIAARPVPKDSADAGLVFITKYGARWTKETCDNPVTKETKKLLLMLKLHRPGLGFYALRHTFETVGGESRDQVAVDAIMGHAPRSDDMASVYRERISDERLAAVAGHVRAWLFGADGDLHETPKRGK
jgi:integrase